MFADMAAGVVAGAFTSLALHPLDVVKVRFQVSDGSAGKPKYRSTAHAFKSIVANESWRGLWKGAVPGTRVRIAFDACTWV